MAYKVGVVGLGVKQYRNHIDGARLNAAFIRRVEGIEDDAHERLYIGTRKAGIARFFAQHNILLSIVEFQQAMLLSFSRLFYVQH